MSDERLLAEYENIERVIEDDAHLAENIEKVVLPLVDGSLTKLKDINPATDEVKTLKIKYVMVMDVYNKGLQELAKEHGAEIEY